MKNIFDKQYEKLNESYLRTIYRCLRPSLEMHIGKKNPPIDYWLQEKECETLCILTAYNPFSKIQTPKWNQFAHNQLVAELEQEGFNWSPGVNCDPGGRFPDELSCWVPGMNHVQGCRVGKRWDQNAIVFYRLGKLPELIWT